MDATNVWCIEPNGAYYSIRAFQNNNPGGYLDYYYAGDYYYASRSAKLSSSPDASTNWHFEVVKDPLKFDFAVSEIRMQPVKDDDIRLTS